MKRKSENDSQQPAKKQRTLQELKNAPKNDKDAMYELGKYYKDGQGGAPVNLKLAVEYFTFASQQGHAGAKYELGLCFQTGAGVQCNPELAFQNYLHAAKLNHINAIYVSALCYKNGYGVQKNPRLAAEYFILASKCNHAAAMYELGLCFETGAGLHSDPKLALQHFFRAAELKHIPATLKLAWCYQNGYFVQQNLQLAEKNFAIAYNIGSKKDYFLLGQHYLYEQAAPENKAYAVFLFKKAGEKHQDSQYQLGLCYQKGWGVKVDLGLAVQCYEKLSQEGHVGATYSLGLCYKLGLGVKQALGIAAHFFKIAADKNHTESKFEYGLCLLNGHGVAKDTDLAVSLFQQNADMLTPHLESLYQLGLCAEKGLGERRELYFAVSCFKKAADKGHWAAAHSLALCYKNGQGTEKNLELAIKYFEIASKNERSAESPFELGLCHLSIPENAQLAVQNFNKAAQRDCKPAIYELAKCYLKGIGVEKNAAKAAEFFDKLIPSGHAAAHYQIGKCLLRGLGVAKDIDLGNKYIQFAASKENPSALHHLGLRCKNNNPNQGFIYFNRAAVQGHAKSLYELGWYYEKGLGDVKPNSERAFGHFKEASDKGHGGATFFLALCYKNGHGTEKNLELAITYFKIAAQDERNIESQFELGLCYLGLSHLGIPENESLAVHYFDQVAEKEYLPGIYELARCHLKGIGVDKNAETAMELFNKLIPSGHAAAHYQIGKCLLRGLGVEKDINLGDKYIQFAANEGNPSALWHLGMASQKNDPNNAFTYFHQAAAQGHVKSLYELALCYEKGLGVEPDSKLAMDCFEKLPLTGGKEYLYKLGLCYLKGIVVVQNSSLAVNLFRQAADRGHAPATYQLGKCYRLGRGVPQNPLLAKKYIEVAADKKHPPALYLLGLSLGSVDPKMAFDYFEQAANAGHAKSLYQLGLCYEQGLGVNSDLAKAFTNYQKAAELNNFDAKYQLGHCYREGKGVVIDLHEAFKCYQVLFKCKPEAIKDVYTIGMYYLKGTQDVKPNLEEAISKLNIAFELGFLEAKFQLGLWYETQSKKELASECYKQYAKEYIKKFKFEGDNLGELYCEVAKQHFNEKNNSNEKKNNLVINIYLEQAAELKNPEAQYRLGDFYSGVNFSYKESFNLCSFDVDIFKAIEYYEKSAAQGNQVAKNRLTNIDVHFRKAQTYENINKDLEKAYNHYIWIIEHLSPESNKLENLKLHVNRLYKKIKIARPELLPSLTNIYAYMEINSLMEIAQAGNMHAQYAFALYCKNKANTIKSSDPRFFSDLDLHQAYLHQANDYFNRAANQGHEEAKAALEIRNMTL